MANTKSKIRGGEFVQFLNYVIIIAILKNEIIILERINKKMWTNFMGRNEYKCKILDQKCKYKSRVLMPSSTSTMPSEVNC